MRHWAFGCVLLEMLTGKRAFEGEDVADTLANVLKAQPDGTRYRPRSRQPFAHVLRRCLDKDRHKRIGDIAAARFTIEEVDALGSTASVVTARCNRALTPRSRLHARNSDASCACV
jgi:serine/threonine protein kinase